MVEVHEVRVAGHGAVQRDRQVQIALDEVGEVVWKVGVIGFGHVEGPTCAGSIAMCLGARATEPILTHPPGQLDEVVHQGLPGQVLLVVALEAIMLPA